MRENQEKSENQDYSQNRDQEDDLETYLKDMKALETDFSDLEDLDFEELQEIQEAISKVKESEDLSQSEFPNGLTNKIDTENEINEERELRETMITDFSDIDQIDFDELKEMQEAIDNVKQEEVFEGESTYVQTQEVSKELEERIKQELTKRKEIEKEIISPEKFLDFIGKKRDKIWYHSLYYLVFNSEDQIASKALLYDVLKETISKSPIDPIPEHQFYFGLGYILRLTLNDRQVVRFMKGGKFKINVNIEVLKNILMEAGEPISTRPIIKKEERKKMFKDFLDEDFLDI